ncbi:MAG: phosphosulfolactate synthase [Bacteroidota bacterium]
MSTQLNPLPDRSAKPRQRGVTMAMDKGLSKRQAEDFVEVAAHLVDVVKIGFGTGYVTANLEPKLAVYREAGIPYYFGGTLFEAYAYRNQFDDYCRFAESHQASMVEVSDGSIDMPWEDKKRYIETLSKNFTVLSEVGSKDSSVTLPPFRWVEMMRRELDAGVWKVIAEARESGTVGVFQKSGETRSGLVDEITHSIPQEKILWEAPQKAQQVWFIKKFGTNVNLGNIAPSEVIPLETLRMGLRGDTFFTFL